jgi:hypothetical protein
MKSVRPFSVLLDSPLFEQRPPTSRLRVFGSVLLWIVAVGLTLWAVGALWFDFPFKALRHAVAVCYAVAAAAVCLSRRRRGRGRTLGLLLVGFAVVLGWWLTLRASNERVLAAGCGEDALGGNRR